MKMLFLFLSLAVAGIPAPGQKKGWVKHLKNEFTFDKTVEKGDPRVSGFLVSMYIKPDIAYSFGDACDESHERSVNYGIGGSAVRVVEWIYEGRNPGTASAEIIASSEIFGSASIGCSMRESVQAASVSAGYSMVESSLFGGKKCEAVLNRAGIESSLNLVSSASISLIVGISVNFYIGLGIPGKRDQNDVDSARGFAQCTRFDLKRKIANYIVLKADGNMNEAISGARAFAEAEITSSNEVQVILNQEVF